MPIIGSYRPKNNRHPCKEQGCLKPSKCKGYCAAHYAQYVRYGHILNRLRFNSNDYIIHDTYAEIILCDTMGNEIGRTIIDKDDVERCKKHKWCIVGNYVGSTISGKRVLLHRFINSPFTIFNAKEILIKHQIDHINRNTLDNRKSNLRVVTPSENMRNSKNVIKNIN